MIGLVASDLDGTLLRSDKTISKETEDVLFRVHEKGTLFVPSTGRTHKELPDPVRNLPFLRYAITCNGGGVYDYEEETYIFDFSIENALAVKVMEQSRTLPVYPTMVCRGERFVQTDADGEIPAYVLAHAASPEIVTNATKSKDLAATLRETGCNVQKFMMYPADPDRTDEVIADLQKLFPELIVTTSGPMYIEVNAPGIDKGKTLRLLCEHVGVSIDEALAFGDAGNDLAMLKAAGRAVVPENGTDEAKALADAICESCDDDGIRKELERLGF